VDGGVEVWIVEGLEVEGGWEEDQGRLVRFGEERNDANMRAWR
jgi:hypothetical protein